MELMFHVMLLKGLGDGLVDVVEFCRRESDTTGNCGLACGLLQYFIDQGIQYQYYTRSDLHDVRMRLVLPSHACWIGRTLSLFNMY